MRCGEEFEASNASRGVAMAAVLSLHKAAAGKSRNFLVYMELKLA